MNRISGIVALTVFGVACVAGAADWPMFRADAARSASSNQELAPKLHLQWVRVLPRTRTAWLDQPRMVFDRNYEPVVVGSTMIVGSPRDDSVIGYDTRTGQVKWTYVADGPIRFAPACFEGRAFVGSDDGRLHCLEIESGKLLWTFRSGPDHRRVLGNDRLISTWPIRGAPVVADGTVYFAAGIWPFMGIFLHALDAHSGEPIWTNDGDGSMYIKQPHNSDSFAGVAPQGPLAVHGNSLVLPGGRSVPAVYDRKTGKMIHFRLADNSKRGGGTDAIAMDGVFFNGGAAFSLETGDYLTNFAGQPVIAADRIWSFGSGKLRVFDAKTAPKATTEKDKTGKTAKKVSWKPAELAAYDSPSVDSVIRAGSRLYAGGPKRLWAIDPTALPAATAKDKTITPAWSADIEGTPVSLLAADDRLFAVTLEGRIYCFGPEAVEAPVTHAPSHSTPVEEPALNFVERALAAAGAQGGWCVVWGAGTGETLEAVLRQSKLRAVAVEADAGRSDRARKRLIEAGVYGERAAILNADPLQVALPPYMAEVMLVDPAGAGVRADAEFARKAFHSLRPFGGTLVLRLAEAERAEFARAVEQANLPGAKIREADGFTLLVREGPLPGSADWTHEHADAANTRVSKDTVVRAPLGLLWFGGSSNEGVLPRHGHGPQPQVCDGKLFIEGPDMMRAMDIYTGRVLWQTSLPGVGAFFNNTAHQPGANSSGTNFISTPQGVYVAWGRKCVRLDPGNGKITAEYVLPKAAGASEPPIWGCLTVVGDTIVAGSDPLVLKAGDDDFHKQLTLWDVPTRKVRETLKGHTGEVECVAFSPDGKLLASAAEDKSVKIWDTLRGKEVTQLDGFEERLNAVAFSPDGKLLAVGDDDSLIRLFDTETWKPKALLKGHGEDVNCLSFSGDGKLLVSGSEDQSAVIWDVASGEPRFTLQGHSGEVHCVAFSTDGKFVVTGSKDESVMIWDALDGKLKTTLKAHTGAVLCATLSNDGKLLATGGKDKAVVVWDLEHGKALRTLKDHSGTVTAIDLAPDGKTLAAACDDATVKLWDVETGKSAATLKGPAGVMETVAFSPDGKTLATGGKEKTTKGKNENHSSSKALTAIDARDGKVLWSVESTSGFRHNTLCAGGGKVFVVDRLSGGQLARLKRRGVEPKAKTRLVALDLATGREVWGTDKEVFGTWLSYSAEHDMLVEAGRVARDGLSDEPKGMRVYRGSDGKVNWNNSAYAGPAMLRGSQIIREGGGCDLLTGKPTMRTDPVTGLPAEWVWTRNYGCNTPMAAQNLLTFRSGAAGYYDLVNDGGTGNFGGFRSSCTNNLVVAGGILVAPDYTRTCTCSYQNQSSIGLVHMPDVETWTNFAFRGSGTVAAPPPPPKLVEYPFSDVFEGLLPDLSKKPARHPVRTLAINLGAPGTRRAPDGRLWLNQHSQATLRVSGSGLYCRHSHAFAGELPWVAASGCRGISELEIDLGRHRKDPPAVCTVRLHFADPDNTDAGKRVFDVTVDGKPLLTAFDIVKEAGAARKAVVKEFAGIVADGKLKFVFRPSVSPATDAALPDGAAPLLCGIEITVEK